MNVSKNIRNFFVVVFILTITPAFRKFQEDYVPVYFREFGVEIRNVSKLGDTLNYNKSRNENFKFVFFDNRGKCYCERYIKGKLFQKGYFENSLDTLRRYVSGRDLNGVNSPIKVQKYFEPLKNGEWITYKNNKSVKELYLLGILK